MADLTRSLKFDKPLKIAAYESKIRKELIQKKKNLKKSDPQESMQVTTHCYILVCTPIQYNLGTTFFFSKL